MGSIAMYILDAIFILVALCLIISCTKRGFLKSLIHFAKTILAFVFAYLWGGQLAQYLGERFLNNPIRDWVFNRVDGIYQKAADAFNAEEVISAFPDFLLNDEIRNNIVNAQGSGAELVNNITDTLSAPVSGFVSNILGYLGVFLASFIVLWIVGFILNKLVSRLFFLHVVNTLLGFLLGILLAAVVMYVGASVLEFFMSNNSLYTDSVVVKFLGDLELPGFLNFLDVGKQFLSNIF